MDDVCIRTSCVNASWKSKKNINKSKRRWWILWWERKTSANSLITFFCQCVIKFTRFKPHFFFLLHVPRDKWSTKSFYHLTMSNSRSHSFLFFCSENFNSFLLLLLFLFDIHERASQKEWEKFTLFARKQTTTQKSKIPRLISIIYT